MSYTQIDSRLWDVQMWLVRQGWSFDTALGMVDPLRWYIWTGRASIDFLHRFCDAKVFVIGRQLQKGGSYDEVIARVKKKLEVE